jgi:hypothetical protein
MQEMPSMHAFGAIRMSFFIGPKPTKLWLWKKIAVDTCILKKAVKG